MKTPCSTRLILCGVLVLGASGSARAGVVDFEDLSVGTVFGVDANNMPGDVIIMDNNGTEVTVENFFLGSFVGFFQAEVGGPSAAFFPTNGLDLNNIAVAFDYSGVAMAIDQVSFDYMYFGGAVNFAVNGGSILELNSPGDIPVDVAPGVVATVTGESVVLEGPILSFRIGGQELGIDNVLAVPEPTMATLLLLGGVGVCWRKRRIRR